MTANHGLTIDDCLSLFRRPEVARLYEHHQSLIDDVYPSMSYMGVNFEAGAIVSLKLYFAIYRRLSEEEVEPFLPHTDDFNRYYALWEPSTRRSNEHTGCTFTIKFKSTLEPSYGFHYRLKNCDDAYRMIGSAPGLPADICDYGVRPGINYEYGQGDVLRKRYYYFDDARRKSYLAERFSRPFINKCSFAELAEFSGTSKVNAYRFDYSDENMSRPKYFDYNDSIFIDLMKNKYGLINVVDGYYEGGLRNSTYFFNTGRSNPLTAFDTDVNFSIDTVGLLLGSSNVLRS